MAHFPPHKKYICKEARLLQARTVAIRTLDRPRPQTETQRLSGRVSAQNRAGHYGPTCKLRLRSGEVRSRGAAALPQGCTSHRTKPLFPQESSKQPQGQWNCDEGDVPADPCHSSMLMIASPRTENQGSKLPIFLDQL